MLLGRVWADVAFPSHVAPRLSITRICTLQEYELASSQSSVTCALQDDKQRSLAVARWWIRCRRGAVIYTCTTCGIPCLDPLFEPTHAHVQTLLISRARRSFQVGLWQRGVAAAMAR